MSMAATREIIRLQKQLAVARQTIRSLQNAADVSQRERDGLRWLLDNLATMAEDENPHLALSVLQAARAELKDAPPFASSGSEREQELTNALRRAVYLAQHLMQMISDEAWRATGGDDGQGHYEGDYHAAKVAEELRDLAVLAPAVEEQR